MGAIRTLILTLALLPAPPFAMADLLRDSPSHAAPDSRLTAALPNEITAPEPVTNNRPPRPPANHAPVLGDLVPVFANCLGRYSAQLEDAWQAQPLRMQAQTLRATFELLLDTVRPASPLTGQQILQLRLEAKFAQAQLLAIARHHSDAEAKRRAAAQAAMALRPCQALLL